MIAATAAAVGIGAGVGAAAIAHRAWLDAIASPPPVPLTFPGIVAAAMVALAAVLAAVTVIVPAIAAVRVPPTAALKDTTAVDEMEMSRRVHLWPVSLLFATFFVALLVVQATQTSGSYVALIFLVLATVVTGIATMMEISRRVIRLAGNALSSSATPWALQAGLTLKAHPRQAVAIANTQMLAVTSITGWYTANTVNHLLWWSTNTNPLNASWSFFVRDTAPHPEYLIAALVIANALTVIIMWSTKRLMKAESGTARALGLSGTQAIAADAAAWCASQCAGILLGWAVGGYGIGAIAVAVTMGGANDRAFAEARAGMSMGLQESFIAAACAVVVAAGVALLAAVALRPSKLSVRSGRHASVG